MRMFAFQRIAATLYPLFLLTLSAQQLQEKPTPTVGPRLVRFAGSLPASANTPAGALVGATFGIYKDEQGGTPLWTETQNVEPAADGKYSVLLGATTDEGIPASVFASGESRWLQAEYQIVGQTPPPRVLLVSVPYALKAADADTIGGKPLSAFVLAGETTGTAGDGLNYLNTEAFKGRKFSSSPVATSGSAGYLGMFTNSTDLGNSTMFQSGSNVGIGTINPGNWWSKLEVVDNSTNASPRISVGASDTGGGVSGFQFLSGPVWKGGLYRVHASDDLQLYTAGDGGNPRVTFKNGGNVGIGTTSPGNWWSKLEVVDNGANAGPRISVGASGTGGGLSGFQFLSGAGWKGGLYRVHANDDLQLYTAGDGANPRVTFKSGGNVGIGTGPSYKLDVNGDVNMTGALRRQGNPVLQILGTNSTAVGVNALYSGPNAINGTAVGNGALKWNTGTNNTAVGFYALFGNILSGTATTTGNYNTAIGGGALSQHLSGDNNTAVGQASLGAGQFAAGGESGSNNTAVGRLALHQNTTGNDNTAVGYLALAGGGAITGNQNTAIGESALMTNTSGSGNTATGLAALEYYTTACCNTATGVGAMQGVDMAGNPGTANTGSYNTAIGFKALYNNQAGNSNIAVGPYAASFVSSGNSGNIHIGTVGLPTDDHVIRIGGGASIFDLLSNLPLQTKFYVAGVAGATVSGVPVLVDTSTGQLGVASSSRRYKQDIRDMGEESAGLLRLRPVTFRYKQHFADGSQPKQYGLIAEEVAEVYPDLVAYSADGKIDTVKYQVLDSMLLNEVQRQQRQIEALAERNRSLEDRLARLEAAMVNLANTTGSR